MIYVIKSPEAKKQLKRYLNAISLPLTELFDCPSVTLYRDDKAFCLGIAVITDLQIYSLNHSTGVVKLANYSELSGKMSEMGHDLFLAEYGKCWWCIPSTKKDSNL